MPQFGLVAMGGTFDVIHAGHIALLERAFSISSRVIIGLTSDSLAAKKGKKPWHTYSQRLDSLKSLIEKKYPGRPYTISPLDDDFGPAVLEGDVEALVVSEETAHQGDVLNLQRRQRGLDPVQTVIVPMILAGDGSRISSTRIRNSEIDADGKLLKS
ncbi:phosphopantetheine adenylyltransferase [Candidatus Nitrosotenuis chungbukensis]|uniref:phosphopantetheine adenylyltransferase n=1 Tax=Candidatus Nitrosotenuis chungbukensis TaxID=1353246 RepID=UPI0005B2C516|nr:pantetheine-phosphate adenylyltransferase [Candidatus Nitrosotenuis chungbukensis]